MKSFDLIQTKLNRPRVTSDLVHRSRLIEKLGRGMDVELALIVAPAGYGKSTLAVDWLDHCKCQSAWLSLDENDSDLTVFLSYFIAAVQTIYPAVGQEVLMLLQMGEQPSPQVLASSLINTLDKIEQPFALVLDDYHLIQDVEIHNLMDELLRYAPRTLHLVLISRTVPPLNLQRLRAQGQLIEIRTSDLCFTVPETAAFVQQSRRIWLGSDKVTLLQEKTEGWITGLRLSLLSLQRADDLDQLADHLPGEQMAVEYLFREVFENQPEAVQEHLLRSSILDRFSASLCEYLQGGVGNTEDLSGQEFIDWLDQAGIFAIPLDDQRQWFRYHHLFLDALRRQSAEILDAERLSRLHVRASEWFAQNGLIDEAIRHALAAGDKDGAAWLVEQNRHEILNADRWPILTRWLSYFPRQEIYQRLELLLTQIWVAHFCADVVWERALLERLPPLLEANVLSPEIQGEIDLFRGESMLWGGAIEQSIVHLKQALELFPAEYRTARGIAQLHLLTAFQMNGQLQKATTTARVLLETDYEDNSYTTRLLSALVFVNLFAGRFTEAYHLSTRLHRMAERMGHPFYLGWANYLLGYIYWGWNDLERAVSYFERTVENHIFFRDGSTDMYIGLAVSYQWMGNPERAKQIMDDLLRYVQDSRNTTDAILIHSAQMCLAMLQGDFSRAKRLAQGVDFMPRSRKLSFGVLIPETTYGRLMIAVGSDAELARSVKILQVHLQLARRIHNVAGQIDALPTLAVAYQKQGKREQAIAALREAVMLAAPDGWLHPFLAPGAEIITLLDELDGDSVVRGFISRILDAFSTTPPPYRKAQQFQVLLTNRELEVLTLLSKRYSNKKIAAELFISPATVKRHTSNIYAKLETHGRQQAVAKAIALGLISPVQPN